MKKAWYKLGNVTFWLSYPALLVYLRLNWRTRVVLMVGDEVLLVKGWLGSGQWQLPGGGVHYREDPAQAACREVYEETGVKLTPEEIKLLYKQQASQFGLRYKYYCYLIQLRQKPALKRRGFEIIDLAWLPLKMVTPHNATQETYKAVQAWLQ